MLLEAVAQYWASNVHRNIHPFACQGSFDALKAHLCWVVAPEANRIVLKLLKETPDAAGYCQMDVSWPDPAVFIISRPTGIRCC